MKQVSVTQVNRKAIIAATDFSINATNAVNYAADLALSINTDLHIVHFYKVSKLLNPVSLPPGAIPAMYEDVEREMKILRENLAERTGKHMKIYTALVEGGVHTQLARYCEENTPMLVVMGSEDTSELERVMFGAKTLNAVKHLPWPLLVIPPDKLFNGIHKIGLAYDGGEVAEFPLQQTKELLLALKSSLYVMHVSDDNADNSDTFIMPQALKLQGVLKDFQPACHLIHHSAVEAGLAEFSSLHSIDMLIIISKQHSLLFEIFRRSHSQQLVLQTNIPVIILHENN